jgi:hypothetical protein
MCIGSMTFRRHHLVKIHIFLQTRINFNTNPPYQNTVSGELLPMNCSFEKYLFRWARMWGICGKGMPVSLIIVISFVITTPETYLHKRRMLLTFK